MTDAAITKAAPEQKKSWVESWVARVKGDVEKAAPVGAKPYVKETGSVARSYVTAAIVAPLLGATDARFGLDQGGVPIDGVLAAVGALTAIGIAGSHPSASQDARLVGTLGFASMLQRKTKSFLGGKGEGHSAMHGEAVGGGSFREVGPKGAASQDLDGDPILKVAAGLFKRKEVGAPR